METGLYTAVYKFVDLLAFVPAVVSLPLSFYISVWLEDKETISFLCRNTPEHASACNTFDGGGIILQRN